MLQLLAGIAPGEAPVHLLFYRTNTLWAQCPSQGHLLDAARGLLVLHMWEGEPRAVERSCMTQKQNFYLRVCI